MPVQASTYPKSLKQPGYTYARARTEIQHFPKKHGVASVKTSRNFITKSADGGWSWLSVKMKGIPSDMPGLQRTDLPAHLVGAAWGKFNLKKCCTSVEALKNWMARSLSTQPSIMNPKRTRLKKGGKKGLPVAQTLMDVLLQNWTYFDHAHENSSQVENHVHAKYCDGTFGHFQLPDGRQIHGSYTVSLCHLIQEIRRLCSHLRSQIITTSYKELPIWKTPEQEVFPEFEPPAMWPVPQLYPIEGLLPIPSKESEDIPPELPPPVFNPPVQKEHASLVLPIPLKVPPMKLPLMPHFLDNEDLIDYSLYKEEPLPSFSLPALPPIPEWEEPQLAILPPGPVPIRSETLPPSELMPVPSYFPPHLESRPCELAYYDVNAGKEPPICDGFCSGHSFLHDIRNKEPCLAKSPPSISPPLPPFPLPLELLQEPEFIPPSDEPHPRFIQPALQEEPVYVPSPPPTLPKWNAPQPPDPFGWLAGQRPIFMIDCSGTMAKRRMTAVFQSLRALFSPGGQVDIAATHFDIIMYSFDAWSFGAFKNYQLHKQGASARFWRPVEVMQAKRPPILAAALDWARQWRPAGATNLRKALDVALSRSFADCIYLITDGKPDKPVLVLESLKRLAQRRGHITPIHTVGVCTSKPGQRFLQKISEATGGKFKELEMEWESKQPLNKVEELEDMVLAQSMIEARQKRNAAEGKPENIQEVIRIVKDRFEEERHVPRKSAHLLKEKKAMMDHQALLKRIRVQNQLLVSRARKVHEQEIAALIQKNKMNYELARNLWMQELKVARIANQQKLDMLERWKQSVKAIKESNAHLLTNAKEQFQKDLQHVEENNRVMLQRARDDYDFEVKTVRAWNEAAIADRELKQKELDNNVAVRNKASRAHYEETLNALKVENKQLLEKAHADYNEKLSYTRTENERIMKQNEIELNRKCEETRMKNAMRKEALQKTLESIKQQKEAALTAHQTHVATIIAEHGIEVKKYAALNMQNEEQARANWKQMCDIIDEENLAAAKNAIKDFEAQQKHVAEENKKLAEQRLALQKRKREAEQWNDEVLQEKKLKWKQGCETAEKAYEQEVLKARVVHAKLCEETNLRNVEVLQAALLKHKAKVAAVQSYNETVRPFVEASNIVKAEVRRLEAFLKYLVKKCLPDPSSRLDADLELLAAADQPVRTKWLIEGLQVAYGTKATSDVRGEQKLLLPDESKKDLSGLLAIHPARARAHRCRAAEHKLQIPSL